MTEYELHILLYYLLPVLSTKTTKKINPNAGIITFTLNGRGLLWKEQAIETIIMIANTRGSDARETSRVIFQLASGDMQFFQFSDVLEDFPAPAYSLFMRLGAEPRNLFNEYGTRADPLWKTLGTSETYTHKIHQFYTELHDHISNLILQEIKSQTGLYQKAATQGMQVISLGCGQGDDLFAAYKTLLKERFDRAPFAGATFSCECYGLDLYQREVDQATSTYSKQKGFTFIQHDLTQVESLIPKLKLKENKVNLLISSGTLTREIMDGAYPVAQVLQKVHTHLQPDLMAIAGYTHTIISPEIAADIGYTTKSTIRPGGRVIYLLLNKTLDEQIQHVERKSLSRNRVSSMDFTTLDLSLSAHPLVLIQAFTAHDKKHLIASIDLSWSYLKAEDQSAMIECLAEFPALKRVIISDCEPWSSSFSEQIRANNRYDLLKRIDCSDPRELPTVSVRHARALGLYDGLPTQTLYKCIAPSVIPLSLFSSTAGTEAPPTIPVVVDFNDEHNASLTDPSLRSG